MTGSHRTRRGRWAACQQVEACGLPFHLPLTVAEITAIPQELLWPLLEAVDPPTEIDADGGRHWLDARGRSHRGYDLPARIEPDSDYQDGIICWYRHGRLHRVGGPAMLFPDGGQVWARFGFDYRPYGPASVNWQGKGTRYPAAQLGVALHAVLLRVPARWLRSSRLYQSLGRWYNALKLYLANRQINAHLRAEARRAISHS